MKQGWLDEIEDDEDDGDVDFGCEIAVNERKESR